MRFKRQSAGAAAGATVGVIANEDSGEGSGYSESEYDEEDLCEMQNVEDDGMSQASDFTHCSDETLVSTSLISYLHDVIRSDNVLVSVFSIERI